MDVITAEEVRQGIKKGKRIPEWVLEGMDYELRLAANGDTDFDEYSIGYKIPKIVNGELICTDVCLEDLGSDCINALKDYLQERGYKIDDGIDISCGVRVLTVRFW